MPQALFDVFVIFYELLDVFNKILSKTVKNNKKHQKTIKNHKNIKKHYKNIVLINLWSLGNAWGTIGINIFNIWTNQKTKKNEWMLAI